MYLSVFFSVFTVYFVYLINYTT